MDAYSREYYERMGEDSRSSAQVIVPLILERVRPLNSVVDVGCGTGEWLEVFSKHQVEHVYGVDGAWIQPETLRFPSEHFFIRDLERPLSMGRRFDLVVSLEVAEHLASGCSETFVRSLTNLGDVILFSAAIPGQAGTNHINLRWQGY